MNLQHFIDSAAIKYRMHQAQYKRFEPKIRFLIDANRFWIKTAETQAEFESILKLRYQIFIQEGLQRRTPLKVDVETWDFIADHLMIIEKDSQKVLGTYRLISSAFSNKFYSQSEFEMQDLLNLPGNKLELGRACVDKSARSGIVMTLLWRGLVRYLQETGSRHLFGCTSIKTIDLEQIAQLTRYFLENQHFSNEVSTTPTRKYAIKNLDLLVACVDPDPSVESLIPSLMQSYLKAGAKVCGYPALDKAFRCVDFLTLLDTTQMTSTYERKYGLC